MYLGVDALDTSGIPHEHLGIALTIENIEKHMFLMLSVKRKEHLFLHPQLISM